MITLDMSRLQEREEAHSYLKEALELPEYYGRNLDALYDCLTDMDEVEIEFTNDDGCCSDYCSRILDTFRDAQLDSRNLYIYGLPDAED